jgi:hypothetical protein
VFRPEIAEKIFATESFGEGGSMSTPHTPTALYGSR